MKRVNYADGACATVAARRFLQAQTAMNRWPESAFTLAKLRQDRNAARDALLAALLVESQ